VSSRGPTTRTKVEVLDGDRVSRRDDVLATEKPLELRLAWPGHPAQALAVTMRTPVADFELAAGFCHGEGLTGPAGLDTVAYCNDAVLTPEQRFNTVTVTLAGPPAHEPAPRYGVTSAARTEEEPLSALDGRMVHCRRFSHPADEYAEFCRHYGRDVRDWSGFPWLRDVRELRMITTNAGKSAPGTSAAREVHRRMQEVRDRQALTWQIL
jgi:hypothetical protein